MIRLGRCRGAVLSSLAVGALLVAGCTSTTARPQPEVGQDSSSVAASTPAASSRGGSTNAGEKILGTWSSSTATTEIAYRFLPDGTYRSVEILSYDQPAGLFQFQRVQDGTARIEGEQLHLMPSRSVRSRANPADPGGDYTDQPEQPQLRTLTWHLDGSTLRLRDADGIEIVLSRQP
jgi:hypothetical protein